MEPVPAPAAGPLASCLGCVVGAGPPRQGSGSGAAAPGGEGAPPDGAPAAASASPQWLARLGAGGPSNGLAVGLEEPKDNEVGGSWTSTPRASEQESSSSTASPSGVAGTESEKILGALVGGNASGSSPASDSSRRLVKQLSTTMRSFLWSKGHRNLLIRGITSFCQAMATLVLVVEAVDMPHKPFLMVFQLVASASLICQWRTADPRMFVVRGCASWAQASLFLHSIPCGRSWIWDHCATETWSTSMRMFRIMQVFKLVNRICNGLSLFCQFLFPQRMYGGHGNEQLFYRGWVQMTGIPINLTIGILKLYGVDSVREHELAEILIDFVRIPIIAVASWSLLDQWYTTGPNNTGHPFSDLYESLSRAGQTPCAALRLARGKLQRARVRAMEGAAAASRVAEGAVRTAVSTGQLVAAGQSRQTPRGAPPSRATSPSPSRLSQRSWAGTTPPPRAVPRSRRRGRRRGRGPPPSGPRPPRSAPSRGGRRRRRGWRMRRGRTAGTASRPGSRAISSAGCEAMSRTADRGLCLSLLAPPISYSLSFSLSILAILTLVSLSLSLSRPSSAPSAIRAPGSDMISDCWTPMAGAEQAQEAIAPPRRSLRICTVKGVEVQLSLASRVAIARC
ncbi:unnamed protein product [Prorocentrum cordatum]|uniref:Uncharacterized protein n=1 Tax=Prorocentrum cordatum TaxID=2364126 RepID=A0ABN9WIG8_9DINO|nr:unnamed protein product [Polarella glacialis]